MKVSELASRNVVTISPDATVVDAAKLMREHHVGDVVVVERNLQGRVPVGIVTDRDIVVGVVAQGVERPADVFVRDIMGRELITAGADESVSDVLRRMRRFGVRRIPVINSIEVLVGIVTYDDLVHVLVEQLAEFTRLLPEQPEHERQRRA
ncbi:CBS domain-containing protein [Myxococcota bacterium]|nr:CBS domain-containing protein [Myxococcota bacterium]